MLFFFAVEIRELYNFSRERIKEREREKEECEHGVLSTAHFKRIESTPAGLDWRSASRIVRVSASLRAAEKFRDESNLNDIYRS